MLAENSPLVACKTRPCAAGAVKNLSEAEDHDGKAGILDTLFGYWSKVGSEDIRGDVRSGLSSALSR